LPSKKGGLEKKKKKKNPASPESNVPNNGIFNIYPKKPNPLSYWYWKFESEIKN
jgi:hypothetical protein